MFRNLALTLLLSSAGLAGLCRAQEPAGGAAPPAAAQEKTRLPDAEIENLAKALTKLREAEGLEPKDERGREKKKTAIAESGEALQQAVQKAKASLSGTDILKLVDSWTEVFMRSLAANKEARPEGLGRVQVRKVEFESAGAKIGYDYAIWLPPGYDAKKPWPLVVCLHDKSKDTDGQKYLNEVWIKNNDPEFKALREQFIFLAPTIGEKTLGKKEDQQRIDWMNKFHLMAVSRPLVEMIKTYNIDPKRIYLDGCGYGGQTAVELATFMPRRFAAAAVRSAEPKSIRFLGNLKNQTALLFVSRADGVFSSAAGKTSREQIEQNKAVSSLDIAFKDYDALPNKNVAKQAMGTQASDPVHDGSAEVLKFLASKSRKLTPPAIRFATNNLREWRWAAWAVIDRGDAEPSIGTEAVIDAAVDREKNVINVTTTNVESFRIFLNDEIADLDRPVKVVVNGKEVRELKMDRSMDFLLQYHKANITDPAAMMVGEMKIAVPAAEETPAAEGEKPQDGTKPGEGNGGKAGEGNAGKAGEEKQPGGEPKKDAAEKNGKAGK